MEKASFITRLVDRLRRGKAGADNARWQAEVERSGRSEEARQIEALWKLAEGYRSDYRADTQGGLRRLEAEMARIRRRRRRRLVLGGAIAASLALALAMFFGLGLERLTLAPASELVWEAGASIERVELEDGTVIHLNRESRLIGQTRDGRREGPLYLEGEAFFEVAPQSRNAFVVRTAHSEVRVLGTAFNLRAFPEEHTTELEVEGGRVAFQSLAGDQQVVVGPGERGTLQDGRIDLREDQPTLLSRAWRNEATFFRNTPMRDVVQVLDRYYGLQVEVSDQDLLDCSYTSSAFRPEEVEDILRAMATGFGAELIRQGENSYLIRGGLCPGGR